MWRDFSDNSRDDAEKVAKFLGIELVVLDVKEKFKTEIVDEFIREYELARTPNPCVICNRQIKFFEIIKKAKELGCELVASGHYARVFNQKIFDKEIEENHSEYNDGKTHLARGVDKDKDQSYMLYRLSEAELNDLYFPLGDLRKIEVREMANKFNIPVAEAKESQEICFTKKNYRDFYSDQGGEMAEKGGNIELKSGEIIGKHEGIFNYTLGQRKGVNQDFLKGEAEREKLYVTKLDVKNNKVVVSSDEDVFFTEVAIKNTNWIKKVDESKKYLVQVRYKHKGEMAKIRFDKEGGAKLEFEKPVRAAMAGQSAVLFDGEEVVGGGIIE